MGCKIILTIGAEKDLESIVEFISADKPGMRERVGRDIVKHLRMLENFPGLGRVVPEFAEEQLREIIHSPCRIIHQINDLARRIEVVRIWHAARGNPEPGSDK